MNGMSLVISKPCCPMYNFGIIGIALSNLQLQGISPLVSTTRMLKHRAYSISAVKDGKGGLRSQGPKYALLGVGIIGIALAKHWEFVAQSVLAVGGVGGVLALYVAGHSVGNIMNLVLVLRRCKPFSIGDIIQTIVNKSSSRWYAMESKILLRAHENEKIHEMLEEVKNMAKYNSNVYLEGKQPVCWLYGVENNCVELTFGCNLKKMPEDELFSAKQDLLLELVNIIKKHGAILV